MDRPPTSPRRWLESPRGWKDRSFKREINTLALRPLDEQSEEAYEIAIPSDAQAELLSPPKSSSSTNPSEGGVQGGEGERKSSQLTNEQQRNFLAQEILSTEQAYVDHLILLIKVQYLFITKIISFSLEVDSPLQIYKQPLFHILGDKELSKRFPDETDLKTLFSNVDAIHKVNAALLEGLETRLGQWKADDSSTHVIGDVFSKMVI